MYVYMHRDNEGGHHTAEDFAVRGKEPADEVPLVEAHSDVFLYFSLRN